MESNSNKSGPRREDDQVARAVDDLAAPLTTIHGYAQLLQRRIRARKAVNNDAMLEALSRIERAARSMEARLRELEEETSREGK